tara:strand:+ start:2151 stop:2390 length:240 start_codon:yes stop_codon:yes gene_type:complete
MEIASLDIFDLIIWAGAGLSLLGLVGIVWCILRVSRAKRKKATDEELRAVLKSVLPLNIGALFLSVFGLMLVIVGIFLG